GLFGCPIPSGRGRTVFPQKDGAHPRPPSARAKISRGGPTLFDYLANHPATGKPQPPAPEETPPPAVPIMAGAAEALDPPDLSTSCPEHPSPDAPSAIAGGERA